MAREAQVGPAIFDRTNELVGEGKSRTDAFKQIAEERDMREGTVAANFYRVARQRGGGRKQPQAEGQRQRRSGGRPRNNTDASEAAQQAVAALIEENRRLRDSLASVKSVLGG